MFQELMPLLGERKIHILVAPANDGKVMLYIEPAKSGDKDEEAAFLTPFNVQATPEELDAQLPAILKDWIGARTQVCASLQEALEASTKEMARQAEEAKQKLKDKATKKPVSPSKGVTGKQEAKKPAAVVKAAAPSLLSKNDGGESIGGGGVEEEGGEKSATSSPSPEESAAPAPVQAVATVESGETVSLF